MSILGPFTPAQLERSFALFQKEFHHIKINNERFTKERMNFIMRNAF